MKKFSKILLAVLAAVFTLNLTATEMPALSYVLSLKIYFLPKELNKEVKFTFFKRDNNGRAGADALAFTVYSPSEKPVFEYNIPDDGEVGHQWKFGPKQKVEVKFTPTEKGVYTLEFKMDCDAYLFFDNNEVVNTYVAMRNNRFRTGTKTPAKLYFYMPVNKVGESGIVDISSSYMHYNQISNMTISDGKTVFYDKFTAAPAANKTTIFAHHFFIKRRDPQALYELTADEFGVISFVGKRYPAFTFFFSKEGAEAFKPYFFKSSIAPNSVTLSAADAAKPFALGAGESYKIQYLPGEKQEFDFTADILGKKYTFKNGADNVIIDVPADNCFPQIAAENLDGQFIISRVVKEAPTIESPADGSVVNAVNGKINFKALQVKGAKKYTFALTHESGKKIVYTSAEPDVTKSVYDLLPGVWQINCTPDNGKTGKDSCFAIPKFRHTTPAYAFGFVPASDSKVKEFKEISCRLLSDAAQTDLKKSRFTVNGKAYQLELLGKDRIGIPADKIKLADGKIDIVADIYDVYGNYSRYEWCFMLNVDIHKTITFDERGYMIFNGRKFLPLICYPPKPGTAGNTGFNTVLPNTLTDPRALDLYLKNNVKSLDSGCVYRGFYTAKDSTPFLDVERYLKGVGGSHPARIGAWLDESDAHVSDEYARKTMQGYQKFTTNCGVVGVCTTGRNRYADMAKMGDYLMVDIYPRENVLSVDYYFPKALKDAAGKPVWQLNQGFDYDYSNRDPETMIPDHPMLKYTHWASFRYGLQGVGLYMCGETRYSDYPMMWEYVKTLYRQAATLSFMLVEKPVAENILKAPAPLAARVVRFGGRCYLIVQNSSWNAFPAALEIKGDFAPYVRVLFEDRIVELKDGKFNDVFQAIESRIYELTEK